MPSHLRYHPVVAASLGVLVFLGGCTLPAQASGIVVILDEAGRKTYVNADPGQTRQPFAPPGSRRSDTGSPIPNSKFSSLIQQTAQRYQVDPDLVHAIVQVESEYNPHARSPKGALGLMQLIPGTAERFGVRNLLDPLQNLEGGVTYLRYLLDLFKGDVTLSLAAYNAGESSVAHHGGVPPYTETQHYVQKVKALYGMTDSGVRSPEPGVQTAKPVAPVYRYVDGDGVLHYEQ